MAKRLTTEDHLALLRLLRQQERTDIGVEQLRILLTQAKVHGLAVKGAAEIAEKWNARELAPALQSAARDMAPERPDAIKRDPGCEGKEAVLRALVEWDADVADFFIAAAAWVQREPVWAAAPSMKNHKDTAAECRGLAAIGIAQTRAQTTDGQEAWTVLIDLLADPEQATRLRAAQSLAVWRGPESVPILRTKAHLGDTSAEVMGEVFIALLRCDPRRQLAFVGRFLEKDEPTLVEAAALALGESRQPAALPLLARALKRFERDAIHTSILMAIALLRHEDSLAWMLEQMASARAATAGRMLQALAIYRGDERAVARIREAAAECTDLAQRFTEIFGP